MNELFEDCLHVAKEMSDPLQCLELELTDLTSISHLNSLIFTFFCFIFHSKPKQKFKFMTIYICYLYFEGGTASALVGICKSQLENVSVIYQIPAVPIGEYGGGVLIHSPLGFFMCDRSEAKVLRNDSAGITRNFLHSE